MNRFKYLQGIERVAKWPANRWEHIGASMDLDGVHIIEYGLPWKGITVIYRKQRNETEYYYVTLNANQISGYMNSYGAACDWADRYIWEHGL
jgi:hypothetical protein